MTAKEFEAALALAKSKADLSEVNVDELFGCGLPDFQPITVTLEQVARHIRWQCFCNEGQVRHGNGLRLKMVRCPHCKGKIPTGHIGPIPFELHENVVTDLATV